MHPLLLHWLDYTWLNTLFDPKFYISYMDTDCLIISGELDSSKGIGAWKLEARYKDITFIAPKSYGGVFDEGKIFTKVKGFSRVVDYQKMKSLLMEGTSLPLDQFKFYVNLDGTIRVVHTKYNLTSTDSKREIIRNAEGLAINTKPYWIKEDKYGIRTVIPRPHESK